MKRHEITRDEMAAIDVCQTIACASNERGTKRLVIHVNPESGDMYFAVSGRKWGGTAWKGDETLTMHGNLGAAVVAYNEINI